MKQFECMQCGCESNSHPNIICDSCHGYNLGEQDSLARISTLEKALREIIDKGDYTAPEGMTRIARKALEGK